ERALDLFQMRQRLTRTAHTAPRRLEDLRRLDLAPRTSPLHHAVEAIGGPVSRRHGHVAHPLHLHRRHSIGLPIRFRRRRGAARNFLVVRNRALDLSLPMVAGDTDMTHHRSFLEWADERTHGIIRKATAEVNALARPRVGPMAATGKSAP